MRRRNGGERLARALAGDLDTIVAHAMRKDPHSSATPRRPPLPMMFAAIWMGVRCWRDPIPVGYRAGKFIARNRLPVGPVRRC